MEQVGEERAAAFVSADSLTQRSIAKAGAALRLIAWEMALATLIIVAALFGAALLLIDRWRRTAPPRDGDGLPPVPGPRR
jgi:hypothetical protein